MWSDRSAMLWLFMSPLIGLTYAAQECSVSDGCEQRSISLLQKEGLRSGGLLFLQEGADAGQSLVAADDFVTNLAQKVAGHNIPMTADENIALNAIKEFIQRLFSTAATQFGADQQSVNAAIALMTACNDEAKSGLDGDVAFVKQAMVWARGNHSTCRNNQSDDNGTMDTTCLEYTQYRKTNASAIPPECIKDNHLGKAFVQTSDKEDQKTMESCLEETKPWLDSLYSKYLTCHEDQGELDVRKKDCDPKQASFESTYCQYAEKLDDECDELDRCMSREGDNRLFVFGDVRQAEVARIADYRSAKRIDCLFTVFEAENKNKKSTLADCQAATYNTDHLVIEYPPAPAPIPCAREPSRPCDTTWLTTEYFNQPWHAKAPTVACLPCVTLPSPAPPPVATPAPAPPPSGTGLGDLNVNFGSCGGNARSEVKLTTSTDWTMVVNYQDDDCTDDIPDSVANIVSGFSHSNAAYVGNAAIDAFGQLTKAKVCLGSSKDTGNAAYNFCVELGDGDLDGTIKQESRCSSAVSNVGKIAMIFAGGCYDDGQDSFSSGRSFLKAGTTPSSNSARWTPRNANPTAKYNYDKVSVWHFEPWGLGLWIKDTKANTAIPKREIGFWSGNHAVGANLVDTLQVFVK